MNFWKRRGGRSQSKKVCCKKCNIFFQNKDGGSKAVCHLSTIKLKLFRYSFCLLNNSLKLRYICILHRTNMQTTRWHQVLIRGRACPRVLGRHICSLDFKYFERKYCLEILRWTEILLEAASSSSSSSISSNGRCLVVSAAACSRWCCPQATLAPPLLSAQTTANNFHTKKIFYPPQSPTRSAAASNSSISAPESQQNLTPNSF